MIFNALGKVHIRKIIDIALGEVRKRIAELGFKLDLSDTALEFMAEKGYDPQFGARPLHRAIQKYLEDELSELILKGEAKKGGKIHVSGKKTKLEFACT